MSRRPARTASLPRRNAIVAGAVFLAACAALPQRPLPPKVEFVGVRVGRMNLADVRLKLMLDVQNPNSYVLQVESIDAEVVVSGVPLAHASLASAVALLPVAVTRVELDLRTGLDKLAAAIERSPERGPVPYEITGIAVVRDGLRLPFTRRGELPLAQWLSGGRR